MTAPAEQDLDPTGYGARDGAVATSHGIWNHATYSP